jgi:hypothetical protein
MHTRSSYFLLPLSYPGIMQASYPLSTNEANFSTCTSSRYRYNTCQKFWKLWRYLLRLESGACCSLPSPQVYGKTVQACICISAAAWIYLLCTLLPDYYLSFELVIAFSSQRYLRCIGFSSIKFPRSYLSRFETLT